MGGSFFYRVGYFSVTENLWKSDLGVIILYRIVTRESLYPRVNILYDTGPCFGLVRSRVGSKYTSAKSYLSTDGCLHRHIAFPDFNCVCVLHEVNFLWKTMVQNCNFCQGLKVKVSSYVAQYPNL